MVIVHVACCLRTAALPSRTCWPSADRSLLSRSKKTGLSGELRFKSSSDADETASSRTGSGGTIAASRTASGGAVGLAGAVLADGGGGTVGLAIGGFFLQSAAVTTTVISSATTQMPFGIIRRIDFSCPR